MSVFFCFFGCFTIESFINQVKFHLFTSNLWINIPDDKKNDLEEFKMNRKQLKLNKGMVIQIKSKYLVDLNYFQINVCRYLKVPFINQQLLQVKSKFGLAKVLPSVRDLAGETEFF